MQSLDSTQYGLALHTTTPQLGLAIANLAGDTRSLVLDLGRDLSTHLHQQLAEFLQPQTWADLNFIAVAKGPGGFTGTRIGVVTARTLAQQLEIPLFAISTLAAVAWSLEGRGDTGSGGRGDSVQMGNQTLGTDLPDAGFETLQTLGVTASPRHRVFFDEEQVIALQMAAQRGQLFTAIYQLSDSGLTPLFPDTVLTPEKWQQTLDSWQTPYQLIDIPAGAQLGTSVSSLLELACVEWQQGKRPHWSEALPFYGQHPVEEK
ncbi:MAG: tRNA (adenosine(37)-N6)-threonylcarbamoyltransferase complex dimerization subunit type 1 TsaB [Coleofasciculus sp. S288]|nr:tRNA (adenosine(37)-N6)-threonylcarbamoyltransferase complex dimerization subunit type 1 TsaB [Coleofasciculus sp. S288]